MSDGLINLALFIVANVATGGVMFGALRSSNNRLSEDVRDVKLDVKTLNDAIIKQMVNETRSVERFRVLEDRQLAEGTRLDRLSARLGKLIDKMAGLPPDNNVR